MRSPFPGMDPYIEACGLWADFHGHLVEKIAEALADATPARYLVRTQERFYVVLVESEGKEGHPFLPDVSVTSPPQRKKASGKKAQRVSASAGTMEPFILRAFIEEEYREKFVEIYEASGEQPLVTTVELLSPSNKAKHTPGWAEYLRKRQGAMLEGVHLVEIDLLRGGERMPMLDPWPDCPYTLLVARASKTHKCKVWPGHFRQALPAIQVPLAKPDADIPLDLQPLIDGIYQRYRYARSIDYSRPLKPALKPEDAAWLAEQVRARQG